jgi:opacity protein-like surface antigen
MDRFDEIWKNRFNESDVPIGDWNTPDDELVWSSIAAQLPGKEKRRLLWLWWVFGLALLMALIFGILWTNQHKSISDNQEQTDKTEQVERNQLAIGGEDITERLELSEEKKDLDDRRGILPASANSLPQVDNTVAEPREKAEPANESTVIPQPESYENTVNAIDKVAIANTEKQDVVLKNEEERAETSTITADNEVIEEAFVPTVYDRMDELTTLWAAVESEQERQTTLPELVEKKQKKFRLNTALSTGASYWKHRISEQYTTDLSPFDFNYTDEIGWQSRLNAQFDLNDRLAIFGGFQYERIRNTSGHNSALNYSLQTEHDNSNDYTENLATPYGPAELSFRFARDEAVAEENVGLWVDFQSSHLIENWSIPLGLMVYPIGRKQLFTPAVTLGFGFNYLSSIANSVNYIETNHDAIQYDAEGSVFAQPSINNWHYDIRLGLGFQYRLNTYLQVQLSYDWTRGLNPIFQQEAYETRIDRHHLSVGLIKSFVLD